MQKPDPSIFIDPGLENNIKATSWMIAKTEEDIARRREYLAFTGLTNNERSIVRIKLAEDRRYLKQMQDDLAMLTAAANQKEADL